MGRVKKGELCSVIVCGKAAIRSLSPSYARILKSTGIEVKESDRLYLCEEHYKRLKKARSGEEQLERWRFSG
ncbi:MAG: hypothetical protein LUQ00_02300 [Candidatus Methanomethyliaceae archaeon]|nr:hypothetical protein [Candidatus Methanomethyliaceae archaeon]